MKFEIFTPTVIHELGQRENQEDSVFPAKGAAAEADRLFLVCDGMGGHAKGEVASANVIDAMTAWIRQRTLPDGTVTDGIIEDALQSAHNRLDTLDDGAENKMGTTLTMVCLHRGGVAMGHVGDSRIYHIRPSQRTILYKSIDHSLVYQLYKAGVISYEEMETSPQRNVITRAIMPGEENKDRIDIAHTTNVQPGDYFYLCSDGMLEEMSDDQLLDVLCANSSDVMKAGTLVSMTEGNKDNHTALLIKIKDVIAEPRDENLLNDEHVSPFNEMATAQQSATSTTQPITRRPESEDYADEILLQAAPPAHNKSTKKGGNKTNKLLLLLVILLLALVAGFVVYFLLNKDKGDNSDRDDNSDAQKIEKVEDKNRNHENQRGSDNTRHNDNGERHQQNSENKSPKEGANTPNNKDVTPPPQAQQDNQENHETKVFPPKKKNDENNNTSNKDLTDRIKSNPQKKEPDRNPKESILEF